MDGNDISHVSWHGGEPNNYNGQATVIQKVENFSANFGFKPHNNLSPYFLEKCIEISNAGPAYEYFFHKQTDCKKCRLPFVPGWNDEDCASKLQPLCERPCNDADCSNDPNNECPDEGWKNDGKGNCYHISLDHKSWGEAQCECAKTGAHLAHMVDTSYEKHVNNKYKYQTIPDFHI